ncbi:MAG: hypothetical protein V3R51_02535 [Gammaproteobacteria bacterium]
MFARTILYGTIGSVAPDECAQSSQNLQPPPTPPLLQQLWSTMAVSLAEGALPCWLLQWSEDIAESAFADTPPLCAGCPTAPASGAMATATINTQ